MECRKLKELLQKKKSTSNWSIKSRATSGKFSGYEKLRAWINWKMRNSLIALKGGRPAKNWYNIQPRDHKSALCCYSLVQLNVIWSTSGLLHYLKPAFLSINNSGHTYSAVPTNDFDRSFVTKCQNSMIKDQWRSMCNSENNGKNKQQTTAIFKLASCSKVDNFQVHIFAH